MLTQKQVLEMATKNGSDCLDGRDFTRLAGFFPPSDYAALGLSLKEGADPATIPPPKAWTRENIVEQMGRDVAFGFEKALDKRGISSGLMYSVVKMWLRVLEDELAKSDAYAQYGLPLFKAVAVKYGFPNPIGEDLGTEFKYSSDAD